MQFDDPQRTALHLAADLRNRAADAELPVIYC
jgi:hypothetical protein